MRNLIRILVLALGVSLALASTAFGGTPGQIFVKGMKPLIGGNGHFVHGDKIEALISSGVAWLGVDCQATVNQKGVVPAYAERIYGRKWVSTAPCLMGPGGWYDSKQYLPKPIPPMARGDYRRRRVQSRQRICQLTRETVRKGEPLKQHAQMNCQRLRHARLHNGNLTLRYHCTSQWSHAARTVRLTIRRVYYNPPYGTLLIMRFTRRNCYRGAVERQVVNGIWSKPRPRGH